MKIAIDFEYKNLNENFRLTQNDMRKNHRFRTTNLNETDWDNVDVYWGITEI